MTSILIVAAFSIPLALFALLIASIFRFVDCEDDCLYDYDEDLDDW